MVDKKKQDADVRKLLEKSNLSKEEIKKILSLIASREDK